MIRQRVMATVGLSAVVGVGVMIAGSSPKPPPAPLWSPGTIATYGVIGDGRVDDTAAIQKAVSGMGGVHFPRGVYRITAPIVVDLNTVGPVAFTSDGTATLLMAGPGPAIKFVGTHAGTADPKTVKSNVWDRQRTPRVEGLAIVGGHPDADGIEADGTMQLTVRGATIRNCRHGIHLVGRNRNVLVSACHIYENRGVGVYLDDVDLHQTNVVGCHISYCAGGGIVTRGGGVRNVQIGTCDIEGCMAEDGPPTANVLIDSTGGSTAEVAITGCTIQHANVPGSANVRVVGTGRPARGADAPKWGHVTIGNNVFSDVAVNVDLKDCRGVTITGNTFWMGYEYNLRAVGCEQLVVGPNAFERNPAYDYGTSTTTRNALVFDDCRDSTLTGLHVHGAKNADAAVVLADCERVNVTGCTLLDCEGVAMLMRNPKNCRVSDCLIRHDGPTGKESATLVVEGGAGNLFADNLLGRPAVVPPTAGDVR